ncbi:MAG: hypothetical protein Q7S29_01965 [Candidatus Peribacter sp.]|nr:hypothetical protein [Candidatus Peribacter sp.]
MNVRTHWHNAGIALILNYIPNIVFPIFWGTTGANSGIFGIGVLFTLLTFVSAAFKYHFIHHVLEILYHVLVVSSVWGLVTATALLQNLAHVQK